MSLFKAAVATAKPATAKKSEKLVVPVDLGDKIQKFNKLRSTLKDTEGQLKMLEGDIKAVGEEQFLKLYEQRRARPESFVLSSGGASVLIITQDKYLSVTEEKETALKEAGMEDLIDEETTFTFDNELLQKYEKQISDAITRIKSIPDEDKARLITATVKKSIRKGTIERLHTFPKLDEAFQLIRPVLQLKNQ